MGKLHSRLHGGLWHTTLPNRVLSIFASGAILPEPQIDDAERWGSKDKPPFVRKLGGVSLFDFTNFDPSAYSEKCPLSSWDTFVPHQRDGAVWLEIDRKKVSDAIVSAAALLARWKETKSYSSPIMPWIEAAYLGDLSVKTIKSAFLTWKDGLETREFDPSEFDHKRYDRLLAEWRTEAKVDILSSN